MIARCAPQCGRRLRHAAVERCASSALSRCCLHVARQQRRARSRALLGDGLRGRGGRPADSRSSNARNPGIRVELQQLPWTAAHEKLLTAFAGDALARRRRARQHLGCRSSSRSMRSQPLDARIAAHAGARSRGDYFPGAWDTGVIDGTRVRGAVVRRHAPAVLSPRPARRRPASTTPPRDVGRMARGDGRDQARGRAGPLRDPAAAQRVRAAAEPGHPAARSAAARRRPLRQFPQRRLQARAGVLRGHVRRRAGRRRVSNTQISNVWNEFGRGYFSFYVTGPWNIAEFRKRLPPRLAGSTG